ncbi:MAG: helix-turn-helix domain-containing protein [Chloroflexi bacterium]|nr:helix-turn-helix domain-containing protein [Chloroflexota bacterium]
MPSLEELRRKKPMTQRELADAAGVSENTIWLIENRRHGKLRPRVMRAIASALGVGPSDVDEFLPSLQPAGEAPLGQDGQDTA